MLTLMTATQFLMKTSLVISRLLWAYSLIIWVRIMLTWFVRYPKPGSFTYYIGRLVDPYLNLFRGKMVIAGRLDFSPILAIGLLEILQAVFQFYGVRGYITLGYILALFIQAFWLYCIRFFIILVGFLLLFRVIALATSNPGFRNIALGITSSVAGITEKTRRVLSSIFKRSFISELTASIVALAIAVALYFGLRYLFSYLFMLSLRIPF